jgi:hypothetical protein
LFHGDVKLERYPETDTEFQYLFYFRDAVENSSVCLETQERSRIFADEDGTG